MIFKEVFEKYRKGKVMTDSELILLHDGLQQIIDSLLGKGECFQSTLMFAIQEQTNIDNILFTRGVKL